MALTEFKQDEWSRLLYLLLKYPFPENPSLWRLTRALKRRKTHISPIATSAGIVYTIAAKAKSFAGSLKKQCKLNEPADRRLVKQVYRNVYSRITDDFEPTSPAEVTKIVAKLNAPGFDDIANRRVKNWVERASLF